jgi:hypothetical protein
LQIGANIDNAKHPFRLILGTNNPHDLFNYKPCIRNLYYLMGFPSSQRVFALLFYDLLDLEMG